MVEIKQTNCAIKSCYVHYNKIFFVIIKTHCKLH